MHPLAFVLEVRSLLIGHSYRKRTKQPNGAI